MDGGKGQLPAVVTNRLMTLPSSHSRKERLGIGAALIFVGWFFWFTVATTGGFRRGGDFDYYNLQVEGWMRGELSLPVKPDPRMLALANPYDPQANRDIRLPDASFYQGRYYIYFGPAPAAVLLLPYRLLTGEKLTQGAAVLACCLVGIGAASAWWLGLRRRYFPESAWWTAGLGILLLGFGTHVLTLARRPYMWEFSIATSYAFTMLALLGASRAVHGRRPVVALGLAGLALGVAIAARPPALLAGVMFLPPLWFLWRRRGPWLAGGLVVAATVGACVALMLWHNHARFGSPFEFGQRYQLTNLDERQSRHFSPTYVLHNIRLYFFFPVDWTLSWPFISARPLPPAPDGYYAGEEVYWVGVLFPAVWFAPAIVLAWWRRPAAQEVLRLLLLGVAGAGLAQGALLLCFFSVTERYMVEFLPCLLLLALGGFLVLEQAAGSTRGRTGVRMGFALAGGVTVTMAILASFDYHQRMMARTDPVTWERLTLSVARVQRILGWRTPYALAPHMAEWMKIQPPGTVRTFPRAGDPGDGVEFLLERDRKEMYRLGASRPAESVRWGDWADPYLSEKASIPDASAPAPGRDLIMRVILPSAPAGNGEPLLVLGRRQAADIVLLRHVEGDQWQVQLDRWSRPLLTGPTLLLERGKWHEIRIRFPSFGRETFGQPVTGEVSVTINGVEAFRAEATVNAFDAVSEVEAGRNRIGATSCGQEFTGWLLQTLWVDQ